jgi:molybdenum cofactor cytidylyltransferase
MIVAVILSAGESSRMGRPKALLSIGGKTFIEHIVAAVKAAGCDNIIVVLGHNADILRQHIAHLPVTILVNADYRKGQLSSLQTAIRYLITDPQCSGVLVHLVDHPFIDPKVVKLLLQRFQDSGKAIVVPRYKGRRGHPVVFARALFDELLRAPEDQGAKAVVNAHHQDSVEIATDDEGITVDIDTPELYRQHVKGE